MAGLGCHEIVGEAGVGPRNRPQDGDELAPGEAGFGFWGDDHCDRLAVSLDDDAATTANPLQRRPDIVL